MNRTQSIALLRALAAVSWADGRLERAEESHLKNLAYRLGLAPDDLRREVQPLLDHPLAYDRAMEIVGDLTRVLGSTRDRELFLTELHQLFESDGDFSPEERQIVAEVEEALGGYGTVDFMIGKLRGAFGPLLAGRRRPTTITAAELGPFAKNKVLVRYLERLRADGIESSLSPAQLNRATLEGAVLSRVVAAGTAGTPSTPGTAGAPNTPGPPVEPDAADRAVAAISRILEERSGLSGSELDVALVVLRAGADETMDRQRLCAELNRVTTMDERLGLVGAMFEVAGPASARDSDRAAQDEIRLLANFLWIPTRDFVQLRLRKMSSG